ncbi:MAG: efflux RND transporter permease subunit [Oligoflexia bacterium]|nr:efflux RND transporter permease subunit [Oligoflexia bacterium]
MNLAKLAIQRPIFIVAVFSLILTLGVLSFFRIGIDLLPDISFPVVSITIPYPGAGPQEVEREVTKIVEDRISGLSGIKNIRSVSREGVSVMMVEFTLENNIEYAEQRINRAIAFVRSKLPREIEEPLIRTFDLSSEAVAVLTVSAGGLPPDKLYDLVDLHVRPALEQINDISYVEIVGGREREIHVLMERNRLVDQNISATTVAQTLIAAGKNIPAGTLKSSTTDTLVRTIGEFKSPKDIEEILVSFFGNEVPVRIRDLAKVKPVLKDASNYTYVQGKEAISLKIYRRSGSNTVRVSTAIKKQTEKINQQFHEKNISSQITIVRDAGRPIRVSVDDVKHTIFYGVVLTILVVFLSLRSLRSTLITGIALPNSLLGAFVLMFAMGFTLNIMTLLALSLAVGLLVDDAIVVRENIFRHLEEGANPKDAAIRGTSEVIMAVTATTLTIIAVFGPIAFMEGVVGRFFKEFGLTICFAMAISYLDSLTMAPMLSAYFAGISNHQRKIQSDSIFKKSYLKLLSFTIKHPLIILLLALAIFILSFGVINKVPKTFITPEDNGEFAISLELSAETSLEAMRDFALDVDSKVRTQKEVVQTFLTVGGSNGESNLASIIVQLSDPPFRKISTTDFRERIRTFLLPISKIARVKIIEAQEADAGVWAERPFLVNVVGEDFASIEHASELLLQRLKNNPSLKDVDSSYRPGRQELQIEMNQDKAKKLGVTTSMAGQDIRTQLEGTLVGLYRENDKDYDIRVLMNEYDRNIQKQFDQTYIPNVNQRLIKLSDVAQLKKSIQPESIYRQNRARYIQISAEINPKGMGLSAAINDVKKIMNQEIKKLIKGIDYQLVGDVERFAEMEKNMLLALVLSILFIYLVLASLYNSLFTPLIIMIVLPLAACGAFYALAITSTAMDLFAIIGCILLLGVATKNSILLVDYIKQKVTQGVDLTPAILEAGRVRLRPIMMTTMALIAGMLPVAIGLSESSKQRQGMGVAIIGGLITSTLLTLVVIPAVYAFMAVLLQKIQKHYSPKSMT